MLLLLQMGQFFVDRWARPGFPTECNLFFHFFLPEYPDDQLLESYSEGSVDDGSSKDDYSEVEVQVGKPEGVLHECERAKDHPPSQAHLQDQDAHEGDIRVDWLPELGGRVESYSDEDVLREREQEGGR